MTKAIRLVSLPVQRPGPTATGEHQIRVSAIAEGVALAGHENHVESGFAVDVDKGVFPGHAAVGVGG